MKSMKKMLIVAIIALVVVVSASAVVSAGLFDGLFGPDLDGQEVNLAAAASLKNVFDEKLIPMFEEKYPGN